MKTPSKTDPRSARFDQCLGANPRSTLLSCVALALIGLSLASCCSTHSRVGVPATAKVVDLKRYSGRWHEIARLPMPFQKADEAAIAEYGSNPDGTISVHNIAIRPDGTEHDIRGYAKVLNPPENTKLAVRFSTWFGPLIPVPKAGNYWVLHVDDQYLEAIVGTPDRKYLWVLASSSKFTRTLPRAGGQGEGPRLRSFAPDPRSAEMI